MIIETQFGSAFGHGHNIVFQVYNNISTLKGQHREISMTENDPSTHVQDPDRKTVAILGGGLTGLAAALHLCNTFNVIVLEKQNHLGGLAASTEFLGKMVPCHYHHVFHHDSTTLRYLQRYGLDQGMQFHRIKMRIAVDGKIYSFTDPISLLKFDYLSIPARIRYGIFGAYVLTVMNPDRINDELDLKTWLEKYAGKEVTEKVFAQLYARNKFNIPLSEISARQFAHRIKAKEAMGTFGYPKAGLQKMITGMEHEISDSGGVISRNYHCRSVDLEKKTIDGEIGYDHLISTIPIPEFLAIATGLPKDYSDRISRIKYCPAVTVLLGTKEFFGDQYWLNILKERVQMLMQHSILHDEYDVKISWALRYGGSEEDLVLDDTEIADRYLETLRKYYPDMEMVSHEVIREKYASPIYDKEFLTNKPDYRSEVDGLYNAGTAVFYPRIRNMNTALESGEEVARLIIQDSSA